MRFDLKMSYFGPTTACCKCLSETSLSKTHVFVDFDDIAVLVTGMFVCEKCFNQVVESIGSVCGEV